MFKPCCLSYCNLLPSGKTVTLRQLLAFINVTDSMVRYITVTATKISCRHSNAIMMCRRGRNMSDSTTQEEGLSSQSGDRVHLRAMKATRTTLKHTAPTSHIHTCCLYSHFVLASFPATLTWNPHTPWPLGSPSDQLLTPGLSQITFDLEIRNVTDQFINY